MRADLPSGTVTFLFTDIEGSTRLLHELGPEAYRDALAGHRRLMREAFGRHEGYEVDYEGDAFFVAFQSAAKAVAAAAEAQAALAGGPIRVRMGLHTGEPLLDPPKYVGVEVHRAARIMSAGHGGQILLSSETASLLDGAALTSLGSHRLKDFAEPVTIFQLGKRSFPRLKTIANSNLPTPASSFLGREEELYEADRQLQETRLLTVTGPGGAGKTRFALELATRAREERFSDYEDGVYSAFLSSLRDPSLVLTTIAVSLDVREQPGQSVAEALSSHLQGKSVLLLLDNLEHLPQARPELSQLLSACSGLTLLCTSRERLRLQGERAYDLPPLDDSDSVSLFTERSGLEPSEAIAELCARLEGLPLAIELAAARSSVLTPQQISTRLSQRLDFLKGGPDRDPRQETLRATIEWSYELLSPGEQRLFAHLSVFAGGCTLEAAEDVAEADLDTVQSLVEKSLLRFTDGRYWLLETVREYAAERLNEIGSVDRVRDRHLLYFCEWAERIEPELKRIDQLLFLNRLEADHANLRTALDHGSSSSGDVVFSARLAAALVEFWDIRSYYAEARMRYGSILSHRDEVPSVLFAQALYGAGKAAHRQGDQDDGCELTRQAVDEFERAEDLTGLALALSSLAFIRLWRGETEQALEDAERSVATAEKLDDPWVEACALAALSAVRGEMKDTVGEVNLLAESLRRFVEVGDRRSQAIEQLNLGVAAVDSGEHERALTFFADAETNARAVDDLGTVANALSERGELALAMGRLDDAAKDFDEALQLGSSYGMDYVVSRCRTGIETIAESCREARDAAPSARQTRSSGK